MLNLLPSSLSRGKKSLLVERLEQVVECTHTERADDVLVVGGHEDHKWKFLVRDQYVNRFSSGICASRKIRSGCTSPMASMAPCHPRVPRSPRSPRRYRDTAGHDGVPAERRPRSRFLWRSLLFVPTHAYGGPTKMSARSIVSVPLRVLRRAVGRAEDSGCRRRTRSIPPCRLGCHSRRASPAVCAEELIRLLQRIHLGVMDQLAVQHGFRIGRRFERPRPRLEVSPILGHASILFLRASGG